MILLLQWIFITNEPFYIENKLLRRANRKKNLMWCLLLIDKRKKTFRLSKTLFWRIFILFSHISSLWVCVYCVLLDKSIPIKTVICNRLFILKYYSSLVISLECSHYFVNKIQNHLVFSFLFLNFYFYSFNTFLSFNTFFEGRGPRS